MLSVNALQGPYSQVLLLWEVEPLVLICSDKHWWIQSWLHWVNWFLTFEVNGQIDHLAHRKTWKLTHASALHPALLHPHEFHVASLQHLLRFCTVEVYSSSQGKCCHTFRMASRAFLSGMSQKTRLENLRSTASSRSWGLLVAPKTITLSAEPLLCLAKLILFQQTWPSSMYKGAMILAVRCTWIDWTEDIWLFRRTYLVAALLSCIVQTLLNRSHIACSAPGCFLDSL